MVKRHLAREEVTKFANGYAVIESVCGMWWMPGVTIIDNSLTRIRENVDCKLCLRCMKIFEEVRRPGERILFFR